MINEIQNVAHYSCLRNLANILHDQKIRLGRVCDLDDPRESSLGWIESCGIGHKIDEEGKANVSTLISSVGKNLRVLCSASTEFDKPKLSCPVESSIYGRPRMWSQYGDNSKGFCVILKKDIISSYLARIAASPKHLISDRVEYFEWLHSVQSGIIIEHGVGIDASNIDIFERISNNNMLKSVYFKKGIDWEEEQEFRWLLYTDCSDDTFISIAGATEAVVLGCRFPTNQISQVKEYCKNLSCSCYCLKYTHPNYALQAVLK